jgi:hypothetical protein
MSSTLIAEALDKGLAEDTESGKIRCVLIVHVSTFDINPVLHCTTATKVSHTDTTTTVFHMLVAWSACTAQYSNMDCSSMNYSNVL